MASNLRLSHRYALALKRLAHERGETARLYEDFKKLRNLIKASEELRVFLRSPVIRADHKIKALERLLGEGLSATMRLFIEKITKARREKILGEIAADFVAMCDAETGKATARLLTAAPLSEEIKEEIRQRVLKQLAFEGIKNLDIEELVKQELVGGFILEVGDRRVDASYANKLTQLRRQFNQNLYVKEF